MPPTSPELVNEYKNACRLICNAKGTGKLDLSNCDWFYPTSLVLLHQYFKLESKEYIPPPDNVDKYISIVLGEGSFVGNSYLPI